MARPLRIEFPGALYHVTARGNERRAIFEDDADRRRFLALLGEVSGRFDWRIHAYCLMGNHYHLLFETAAPTLARGMRQLNGVYSQAFNRRHGRSGHLLQGRYHAVLVEREAHLLELARYVLLNPVRAGLCARAEDWPWSSARALLGLEAAADWLAVDEARAPFGRTAAAARAALARFLADGLRAPSPWERLRGQIYLGGEAFAAAMQARAPEAGAEVPRAQRRPARRPVADYAIGAADRAAAMARAHLEGGWSLAEVARAFGVHYSTVSRAARRARADRCVSARPDP